MPRMLMCLCPTGASRLTKSLGLVEYGDELIVKEILSPD
jgi:hypothetical protein